MPIPCPKDTCKGRLIRPNAEELDKCGIKFKFLNCSRTDYKSSFKSTKSFSKI